MALPPPSHVPPPTDLPLPHPDAYDGEPREYARALMQRKEQIEREIVRPPSVAQAQAGDRSCCTPTTR